MKDQENHCSVFAAYKSEPMDIDHNETLPAVYDASLLPAVVGMSTTEVIDSCVDQMVSALHTKCDAMLSDATIKQQDMIEMQQLVSRCKGAIVLIAYYIGRLLAIVKKKRLYRDIGYDSFECYTSAELRIKHSQAAKYIAIAKKLPQDLASQLAGIGLENAYRLLSLDIEVIEEFVHDHDLDHMTVKQATPIVRQFVVDRAKIANARYRSMEQRAEAAVDILHNQLAINAQIRKRNEKLQSENDCLRSEHHLPVDIPMDIPDNPVMIDIKPNSVRDVSTMPAETISDDDNAINSPKTCPENNALVFLHHLEELAEIADQNLTDLRAMDNTSKNKARSLLESIIAKLT